MRLWGENFCYRCGALGNTRGRMPGQIRLGVFATKTIVVTGSHHPREKTMRYFEGYTGWNYRYIIIIITELLGTSCSSDKAEVRTDLN